MRYTGEQIYKFEAKYRSVTQGLDELMLKSVLAGHKTGHLGVREHLLYGVSRRANVLKRCLENIFSAFPPTATKPLPRNVLCDVQINLHAYVTNLYGVFDNWAWAFVYQHDLLEVIGGKHRVGMFRESTTKHLPNQLSDYLTSESIVAWHKTYLKSYRDSLAHRIPLYIPPAELTKEEGERFNKLESKKMELIEAMEWKKLEDLNEELENIGTPSFVFMHSYKGKPYEPVLFHPQLLSDGLAIIEFGSLYMKHWEELV